MAEQIDKGAVRQYIKRNEKRVHKKLHRREKRREAKRIELEHPQYNRYSSGWAM